MQLTDTRELTKNSAENFIENLAEDVFIVGSNKYGIAVANWLTSIDKNVVGYIDDFINNETFNNIPIYRSKQKFENSAIINCVVEGRTALVNDIIKQTGCRKNIDYFSLQYAFPQYLIPIDWFTELDDIILQKNRYVDIFERLADDRSKKEFQDILNFRLNRNPKFLNEYEFKPNDAYFEDFVTLPARPTFVDAGGFDGLTSLKFAESFPNYSKIYYFEPSEKSLELSKRNLRNKDNIFYFQKGLWDSNTILKFDSGSGSSSKVSEGGDIQIETVSLDSVIADKVDFIKMDIESSEKKALLGSRQTISKYLPKLAICIYHRQSDFIEIPEFVLSINPDYKIYIRHYTQGVCETVMYFI